MFMDQAPPWTAPGPVLLLGKPGEALAALFGRASLRDCFLVATPETSTVESVARSLGPAAVVLEASEYYLEGSALVSRLRACSGGSRVVFLDVDRDWALWLEPESGPGREVRILPCELGRAGEGLRELLSGSEGVGGTLTAARAALEAA